MKREPGAGSREPDAPSHRWPQPSGATLVELLAVLVLLGVMLSIVGVGAAMLRVPRETELNAALRRARAEAIRTGHRAWAPRREATAPGSLLPAPVFLPDGRALGPGVDPLTGAPR